MAISTQAREEARARVADNLRRMRAEAGLSQEELAELAGFHRTYLSQVERCKNNLSLDSLVSLASALGVDVVDLLRKPA